MTDQNQSLRDDIAFLRGMAESGRDRPMIGGSILLAAGLIFGLASLTVWVFAVRGVGGWMYNAVWGASFVLYMAVLFWLLRTLPKSAGALQAATGVAWSAIGAATFFIGLSLGLMAWRLDMPNLMLVFPSVLLALYGACWMVGAILLRTSWMRLVAAAAFAMAIVNAWFADGHAIWLIYGVSLLALLAAPGFVLMRQGRKA
jgi:prepilin-type processing-associated H-X9-DG protein